jgi:hypothetical protein
MRKPTGRDETRECCADIKVSLAQHEASCEAVTSFSERHRSSIQPSKMPSGPAESWQERRRAQQLAKSILRANIKGNFTAVVLPRRHHSLPPSSPCDRRERCQSSQCLSLCLRDRLIRILTLLLLLHRLEKFLNLKLDFSTR